MSLAILRGTPLNSNAAHMAKWLALAMTLTKVLVLEYVVESDFNYD